MKKPCEAAALHLALGALKPGDVPVGHHDLSRVQLVLTFPGFAAVVRAAGSAGDGFDALDASAPALSEDAVLLFLEQVLKRARLPIDTALALWSECIRAAEKGMKAEPPAEALAALAQIAAGLPAPEPAKRRTPAKRVGADEVAIAIKRLPKGKGAPR